MNNDRIKINNASINEVKQEFTKYFTEEDSDKIIKFLSEQQTTLLDDSESFRINTEYSKTQPGLLGMMIVNTNYFINIKLSSIALIAFILDCKVNMGIFSLAASAFGKTGQLITVLSENDGSKCLVREAISLNNRTLYLDLIPCGKNECINNDINCKYRSADICNIKRDDIIEILDTLVKKSVFEKVNNGYKVAL